MSIGVMRLEKRGSMAVSLSDVISASETGSNHCPWQTRSEANPDPYKGRRAVVLQPPEARSSRPTENLTSSVNGTKKKARARKPRQGLARR